MLKKACWIALPVFLIMVCLCFSSSQQDQTPPVPPEVTIEVPDPSLPVQIKSFLGKWVGQWKAWKALYYGWDAVVYVEKVEKDSDRDYWMTSQEAKDYGMIDEILQKEKSK